MEQLSGVDAGFLYMETPTLHMHTIKVVVLHIPNYDYQRLRAALAQRLSRRPPFRRRLAQIPFGLGHPVWVADGAFDVDRHLVRRTCEAPGGLRELAAVVSEVAGTQLDRSRPLWELHIVEGVEGAEGGSVALVAKIHHCVADGVAALDLLLDVVNDAEPEGERRSVAVPEPMPSRGQLLAIAAVEAGRRLRRLPRLVVRTIRGLRSLWRRTRLHPGRTPTPFGTPRTAFNGSLTAGRSFGVARLAMPDVLLVKKHFGVTVNSVVLAICAGALRRLLDASGGVPELPLLSSVPVSTRGPSATRAEGNHLSNLITSLHTDIADPAERLRAIASGMDEVKARHEALGPDLFERWAAYTPPRPQAAMVRAWSASNAADHVQPPVNLIVSNVPGPREPIASGDVRITALYSVGPILEGIGLNLTVWSYAEQLNVGVLACSDHDVDVWRLAEFTRQAADELVSLVASDSATWPARCEADSPDRAVGA